MSPVLFIIACFAIGFASGLRAFAPLALSCWIALWGWMPLGGTRLAFLGTTVGACIVTFLALGELVGDKLPFTPARTTPMPLGGRVITGALCGIALAIGGGESWVVGAVCAILGAIAGAYIGYHVRRFITHQWRVRDWMAAVAEDLFTIVLSLGVFALVF